MKNFKNIVLSSLEMKERNIRSENIVIHKLRRQFYLQNTRKCWFYSNKKWCFWGIHDVLSHNVLSHERLSHYFFSHFAKYEVYQNSQKTNVYRFSFLSHWHFYRSPLKRQNYLYRVQGHCDFFRWPFVWKHHYQRAIAVKLLHVTFCH